MAVETMRIGADKQLFLDQRLCAASAGVRLVMNRPARTGEVLLGPGPYEKEHGLEIGSYSSVRREGGLTRLWYFASGTDIARRRLCYAEAADGLNFSRRPLSGGLDPAYAVLDEPVQGGCVWVDPQAPPDQRYRSQAKWGPPAKFPEHGSSLHFYASPDGLSWRPTHYLHAGECDTQTVIFHDPACGRYLMYTRAWSRFEDPHLNHRKVRRLESDDLVHWEKESIAWEADEVDLALARTSTGMPPVDCYGACVFRYPGAGDFYIFLVQNFWHWRDRPAAEKWGYSPDPANLQRRVIRLAPAVIDARLGYGRDGVSFRRAVDRGPFIGVGPAGRFDSRGAWVLPDPVFTDDEIWFYYVGTNRDHDGFIDPAAAGRLSGIGRAVLRLDGFVSAEADRAGGWLQTPPLVFGGGDLWLNLSASAGGAVTVEALDERGQPLAGYAGEAAAVLCDDAVRRRVRWAGGAAGALAGRPVCFRFGLREAKLYSFRVGE